MKKTFTTIFIFSLIFNAFAGNVTINGTILHNSFEKVSLQLAYGNTLTTFGETDINSDGTFNLSANIQSNDIFRLYFNNKNAFLICLAPGENVSLTLDANDLQSIVSVSGSPSMDYAKKFIDIIAAKNTYLAKMNQELQNDKEYLFYAEMEPKFNAFNQTNVKVDQYIKNAFSAADSLKRIAKTFGNGDNTINTKNSTLFLNRAMQQFNDITTQFEPYKTYKENIDNYNSFLQTKQEGFNNFYKQTDSYMEVLTTRHKMAENILSNYALKAAEFSQQYNNLLESGDLEKKKVKNEFCNTLLKFINENSANLTEQQDLYATNSATSDLLAKDITATTQNSRTNIVKKYQDLYNAEETKQNNNLVELVKQNEDDLATLMFLDTYFPKDKNKEFYTEIATALYKRYPENPVVKSTYNQARDMNNPDSATVGNLAPELEFPDPNSNMRKLSDLRGKVVLLDFWASWCRPCRNANPGVVALYNKYHDQGFDVFSVSLDRDKTAWQKAIAQDKLAWKNHVSDLKAWNSAAAAIYNVRSIPTTFLLDKQGRIVAIRLMGPQLEQKIQELLKQ